MSQAPRISTNALEHNHSIVVFVNIDWKASRHATVASANRNMTLLKTTVGSIIRTHEPVVICFCEVGESSNPLTLYQMSTVSQAIEDTWHELLQSTQLQCSFKEGYPYLTVWDSSRVHCFNFHITKCYEPQPFRTAQLFGMRAATLEVDIVNIHLASGKPTLTDAARKGSLRNILQRKSSLHDGTIGQSRSFLVGGDMNTSKERMSLIFSTLKREHLLQSDAMPNFIEPPHGKHGDLAIAMDQDVSLACGEAINHDLQHVPVALKLLHRIPTQNEELEHVRTGHLRPAHYNNSVSSCAASEIAEDVRPQDSTTSLCTATEHAESIMIAPDLRADPSPDQGKAQWLRFCSQTALPTQKEELEHVGTGHLKPAHYNNSVSSCAASEIAEIEETAGGAAQWLRFCPQTALPTQKEELEHVHTGHLRPAHYNNSVSSCAASEIAEIAEIAGGAGAVRGASRLPGFGARPPTFERHWTGKCNYISIAGVCCNNPCAREAVHKGHCRCLLHFRNKTETGTATEHGPDSPCTATEHAEAQQDNESASPYPNNDSINDVEPYTHNDHDGQMSVSWVTDDELTWQYEDKNANHLGPEAEKLYCSISLLMWSANLDNLEVEKIIHDCIQERLTSSCDVIHSMEEICYPFFFAERTDNTKWKPHDLYQIIQNLLWYDWFRQGVLHKYGLPATTTLTEAQCADCWKDYLIWFRKNELRGNQRSAATSTYMAARMHRDVGNRFAVYATWKFGLPTMGEPLRQTCLQAAMLQSVLSWQDKRALWEHVDLCISWCQSVAQDIRQRKTTDKYIEDKRKSGSWKQTGLNDTELAARQHKQQQQQQHRWRR